MNSKEGHLKRWVEDATREARDMEEFSKGEDWHQFDTGQLSDLQAMRELDALESAAREALQRLIEIQLQEAASSKTANVIHKLRSALKAL